MLKRAIRGMIPYQKPRGLEAFKRLKVDVGTPLSLKEEKAQTIDNAKMNNSSNYVKLGEVSKILGAKF